MSAVELRSDCISHEVCRDLHDLLIKFRLPEASVGCECPTSSDVVWPCESMMKNVRQLYDSISPANAEEVLEFIAQLFSDKAQLMSELFRQYMDKTPFHCPEIGIDVYQPCLASSCVFHTKNPWDLNCILFYRLRHERDVLSLNELAFLLGHNVGSLRSNLNRVFKRLSRIALKETIMIENLGDLVIRVQTEKVCVVCEHQIDKPHRVVVRGGFSYCGSVCSSYKPPNVIQVEQEFMLPIEILLDLCVARFSNIKNMCSALGVGSALFIEWCAKYNVVIPGSKLSK
jgi:hypothetical protein